MNILCELPNLIFVWTGLILSWGIFTSAAISKLMEFSIKIRCSYRKSDVIYKYVMLASNALVFVFLFFVPHIIPSITDVVIVFDVFMTGFLIYITVGLVRWYQALRAVEERLPYVTP
jgi:hypothetical protein